MRRLFLLILIIVSLLTPSCTQSGPQNQTSTPIPPTYTTSTLPVESTTTPQPTPTSNLLDSPMCWDEDTFEMGDICLAWHDDEKTHGLAIIFESIGGQPAAGLYLVSPTIREDLNAQYLESTTTFMHRNLTALVSEKEPGFYSVKIEMPMVEYKAFDEESCLADGLKPMYVGDFLPENGEALPSSTTDLPGQPMSFALGGRMHRVHDDPEIVFAVTTTGIALYEYQPDHTYQMIHPLLKAGETHIFNYPLTIEKALVVSATNCGGGFYSYKHWFAKPQLPGTGNT